MTDSDAEARVSAPSECPFCRSHDVGATGRKITVDTYWRCHTCGQIWNPVRVNPTAGRGFDRPR
jgi:ribosomal protein L37AE/L43A